MIIYTLEIAGFESSFKAMRLPKKSISDSLICNNDCSCCCEYKCDNYNLKHNNMFFGEKDIKLAQNLILAGPEHAKHMRGIIVWFEITAQDWFLDELSTYEVGVTKLPSTSSMHCEYKNLNGEQLEIERDNQSRSFKYTRIYLFSYQALRNLYFQRRSHRLPSWKKFCSWIETLPLSKELITIEKRL